MARQSEAPDRPIVHIDPWAAGDLRLLEALNAPEMTPHVGGPESPGNLADRKARYEEADSRQYRIVVGTDEEGVGWVGYWERRGGFVRCHDWRLDLLASGEA